MEVDQCEHCGGIWFDKYELYSMKAEEGEKFSIEKKYKVFMPTLYMP
ncbi:MAG: zf-TFIIB domain-containing protein [Dictyoglomus sp.]